MVALTDLSAQFVKTDGSTPTDLGDAQGVSFLCPSCANHIFTCWSVSRGVANDMKPGPGRWSLNGTSLSDLTLGADPPLNKMALVLLCICGWRGSVSNGQVTGN